MHIPLVDLRAQYLEIKDDLNNVIRRVLSSGEYVLGEEVSLFESEFAAFTGGVYGIGVNSGTSALILALRAAGIGPGHEVITVPFTFVATVAAIEAVGAKVRLVDIDPRSLTMDVESLAKKVTNQTKAILPVHVFGQAVDMDAVNAVARQFELKVIEDACQAHGASYKGKPVGSLGDLGCFSFYPTKNLGACGEGGMIVTNDTELASTIRSLRDWGKNESKIYTKKGGNYRLDEIQAAILRIKLKRLPSWIVARRAIAAQYDSGLTDMDIRIPVVMPYAGHVYHMYAVRTSNRDALAEFLISNGISVALHYSTPVHLQPAYSDLGYREGDFPGAEEAAREILTLPMYPELPDLAIEKIINTINIFFNKFGS